MAADPAATLRRVFGFPGFRGLQEAAIEHVIAGGDALVLMPTGGGKSLCYQIPALCRPGTGLVVSPLIALMEDQVAALRQQGVAAAALHSERTMAENADTMRAFAAGGLDLLYLSPERLLAPGLAARLARGGVALIAIDEAHCVSQWGHEFRRDYRDLARLADEFPAVPRVALTATADRRTREDMLTALAMPQARIFTASFHRPNLALTAESREGESAQLEAFLGRHEGESGIVYCGTRARTERTAARLAARGRNAVAFHAGLEPAAKRAALASFRAGDEMVMVATIAFGMGIDRPDLRFIVHLDLPESPEAYYQQIGRAGRDGEPAEALLLHGVADIVRARHFLAASEAPEAQKRVMARRLEAMVALAETTGCRTRAILAALDEALAEDCGHCDNCRSPPAETEASLEAQKLLSAIHRTGQRFGAQHVIAVLRGEISPAIVRCGHDRLGVFGIGAGHEPRFWRALLRRLVVAGAVTVEEGEYPTLALVPERARPILRGEEKIALALPAAPGPRPPRGDRRARAAPEAPAGAEGARFAALRAWRLGEAKAQGVPPYVIFHDSVLREIAAARPTTADALGLIRGVGASKLARYGAAVLAVLE